MQQTDICIRKRESYMENLMLRIAASDMTDGQKRAIKAIIEKDFLRAIEICVNMEASKRPPTF